MVKFQINFFIWNLFCTFVLDKRRQMEEIDPRNTKDKDGNIIMNCTGYEASAI